MRGGLQGRLFLGTYNVCFPEIGLAVDHQIFTRFLFYIGVKRLWFGKMFIVCRM